MQITLSMGEGGGGSGKPEEFRLPELEDLNLQVVELEKRLLALRFAFGTLKKNLADAFAPLAAVVLPVVTRALYGLAQTVKTVGQVVAGLLGVQVSQDKVTKSIKKTTAATSAWLKRSLAAFDQLNRLQKQSGGSSTPSLSDEEQLKLFPSGLTEDAQEALAAIQALLAPLREIDLEPARWAFERLRECLANLAVAVGEAFTQLWNSLLVPLVTWLAENLAPALLNVLGAAVQLAADLTGVFGDSMVQLLEALEPVASFLGQVLVDAIEQLRQFFLKATNSIHNDGSQIEGVFRSLTQALEAFWEFAKPMVEKIAQLFSKAMEKVGDIAITVVENALMVIGDLLYALTGLLSGDMEIFWDGMEKMAKHAANAIIAVLNGLLLALAAAINGIFKTLNSMTFDVPKDIPFYGGKKFKFNLPTVEAPQIPYLARGAVLPANKPFLAVVGDQKHGTNIEAPLSTIQEAVAVTMGDFTAGQAATVQVLTDILQAVLGISIGDEQLAAAVDRCHARRAVMRGGY